MRGVVTQKTYVALLQTNHQGKLEDSENFNQPTGIFAVTVRNNLDWIEEHDPYREVNG